MNRSSAPAPSRAPSRRSHYGLDWLNFFVADVQTGFGPFVAVYLALHGWTPGRVGLVLAVGSVAGIVSQVPAGALVDHIESKRGLIGAALVMTAASALLLALWPDFWPIAGAEVLQGTGGAVIRMALAALGLGLVGHRALHTRLGRNQIFNALGTAATAGAMGLLGSYGATQLPFFAAAGLCIPAALALVSIKSRDIDYAEARSAGDRKEPKNARPGEDDSPGPGIRSRQRPRAEERGSQGPRTWSARRLRDSLIGHDQRKTVNVHRLRDAARNRHLHVFVVCLALFQFANAALVPLAGDRLGYAHHSGSELMIGTAVLVPQLVAAGLAGWIGRLAGSWGRKPLLLIAFAVVAARGLLFALTASPTALIVIQAGDGVSAAAFGVLMPLVIADLTRGTGRYNLAQGFAGTAIGVGAALSTATSGYVVERIGYTGGFIGLAAIGVLGLLIFWRMLPETRVEAGCDGRVDLH